MAKTAIFTPSANNIAFADSTVALLDALSVKRDAWEQGVFKAANEALYALLAETLDVYNSKFLQGSKDDQRTLRQQLASRLKEMGIKTQKNSTALNMLVRFVFKSDRKRERSNFADAHSRIVRHQQHGAIALRVLLASNEIEHALQFLIRQCFCLSHLFPLQIK